MKRLELRLAVEADLPQINAIYNNYVASSTCVWTTQLCTEQERQAWFAAHTADTPVLVAAQNGNIVGWGALALFQTACTFHRTVENSVFVHHLHHRRGIGRRILAELIRCAQQAGFRSIIAAISADQSASIALHRAAGFEEAGCLKKVGHKFNRYQDLLYLQYHLSNS